MKLDPTPPPPPPLPMQPSTIQYAGSTSDLSLSAMEVNQVSMPSDFNFQVLDPALWFDDHASRVSVSTDGSAAAQAQSQAQVQSHQFFLPQSQSGLSALSFMGGQAQDMFAASNSGPSSFGNAAAAAAEYSGQHQQQHQHQQMPSSGFDMNVNPGVLLGSGDTVSLWSNMPTGFE
jgi:hypothetical protein